MSVDTHRGTKNKRGLPFASNASFGIVIGGKPIKHNHSYVECRRTTHMEGV